MSGKQFTNELSLQLSINPISQMKRHSLGILFLIIQSEVVVDDW